MVENKDRMKVVERVQKELIAYQFNNDNKDDIFTLLAWYHCNRYPSFDKDKTPIMKLTIGNSTDEIEVKFGDWIILDNISDTVVEVLHNNEFYSKYRSVYEPVSREITEAITVPCSIDESHYDIPSDKIVVRI